MSVPVSDPATSAVAAPASVELRNVVKTFGQFTAVAGISLSVAPGEFLTLLGPSGCGKTTTLRIIAGFERPTSGTMVIGGRAVQDLPPYKRPVNTVFQNYALFPHMTVFDNVAFGLRMKRVPADERRRRVSEALSMVRLEGLERRKPAHLSGGQQQRVALARALVNRPTLLLLDEPLGALDLKLRRAMQLELRTLNREVGITFIYVTHDQEEALSMSDRIAVMSGGHVLQAGTAEQIYEHPTSRFVADFIGETNLLEGQVIGAGSDIVAIRLSSGAVVRGRVPVSQGQMTPSILASGSMVTVAIRPERISVSPGAGGTMSSTGESSTGNGVTGTVAETVYLGSTVQYVVRLANGLLVNVRCPAMGNEGGPLAHGATVWLSWRPSDASILTR